MKVLWAAAFVLLAGSAQAERYSSIDGAKLASLCASQDKSVVNDCTSYITGVSDSISFYQSLRPADGSKGQRLPTYICMPTEVTGVKQREAVVAWLKKKPDDSRRQAVGVVANAFADAFPCR